MVNITTLKLTPITKIQTTTINGKQFYYYDTSAEQDNWSQRNSKYNYKYKNLVINGYSLCNVHVMAMGLIYAGVYDKYKKEIDAKYPELTRFPDKLAKYLIEDKEIRTYYKKRYPSLYKDFNNGIKNAYSPNEIHNILSYGTNKFLDVGNVTYFSTYVSWKEIIGDILYRNTSVGISGKFSGLDHIVLAVGVGYSKLDDGDKPGENQTPDYIIVDDPYGKTYEYSKLLSGNNIWIPFNRCVEDFKNLQNPYFKFAHRFIKPQYLGF